MTRRLQPSEAQLAGYFEEEEHKYIRDCRKITKLIASVLENSGIITEISVKGDDEISAEGHITRIILQR